MSTAQSVTLKAGQIACCPICKRNQSDPVQDYFSSMQTEVSERCESCAKPLRFIRKDSGDFEIRSVPARQTV